MRRIFDSGRYGSVTATLALIVALGGTGYAAVTLPRNSVGSKQIKRNGVSRSDLRTNAVTSAKIRDGSLRARDFKPGELLAAVPAAADPKVRWSSLARVPAGERARAIVPCGTGERALSGGLFDPGPDDPAFSTPEFREISSQPISTADPTPEGLTVDVVPVGWSVVAENTRPSDQILSAYAICARP